MLSVFWLLHTYFIVFLPSLLLFPCPLFPSTCLVSSFTYCFFLNFPNFCFCLSSFPKTWSLSSALDITCWHSFIPLFLLPPPQFVISKNDMFALISIPSKPEIYLKVETIMPEWNCRNAQQNTRAGVIKCEWISKSPRKMFLTLSKGPTSPPWVIRHLNW